MIDVRMYHQVYLPAIAGHVPGQMVRAMSAFLDFCYLVRRDTVDEDTIDQIEDALARFHRERTIFETTGVRLTISLPRQHAMKHYVRMIRQFGSPNGLCSSMMEAKHIIAVKEPYRRSNKNNALGQIIKTNERLDKLTAFRVELDSLGMLDGPCPRLPEFMRQAQAQERERDVHDSDSDSEPGQSSVHQARARKHATCEFDLTLTLNSRLQLLQLKSTVTTRLQWKGHPCWRMSSWLTPQVCVNHSWIPDTVLTSLQFATFQKTSRTSPDTSATRPSPLSSDSSCTTNSSGHTRVALVRKLGLQRALSSLGRSKCSHRPQLSSTHRAIHQARRACGRSVSGLWHPGMAVALAVTASTFRATLTFPGSEGYTSRACMCYSPYLSRVPPMNVRSCRGSTELEMPQIPTQACGWWNRTLRSAHDADSLVSKSSVCRPSSGLLT